ncbi:hypothetical protein RJJ65_36625, partial [Rhizobium hidalgonense]
ETSKKVLQQHASDSKTMLDNAVKKSSREIYQNLETLEDGSPILIKTEVLKTIDCFRQKKEEEYDKKVGKGRMSKVFKMVRLDENYAINKSKIEAELDDLKKAFQGGDIKLQATEMEKLAGKIEEKLKYLEDDYKNSIENTLYPILTKFNLTIERINTEIIEDISKISQEFKRTGIDIK